MIGKLSGIVDSVEEDLVVLDVGGVGYNAYCSPRLLVTLAPGTALKLIIETQVREDHIHLFGFENTNERDWFRLLTGVQRVGARMALAILGHLTTEQVRHAILAKDTTAFSRISGIGPKLAERIVAELKDKALKVAGRTSDIGHRTSEKKGATPTSDVRRPLTNALEDTVSALTHLGYSRSDAYAAALAARAEVGTEANIDALIKRSLRELAD